MTDGNGFRASRRTMLWTGMSAVAASLIPARAGAQAKIAPKLVQYQENPEGAARMRQLPAIRDAR